MLERFENKYIKMENGCWEWQAAKHERGYGYFYTPSHYSKRKMDFAHRVSMFLYKGEKHDDLCVMHKCDNPSCVNPAHLHWGTHEDNMKDMASKGRSVQTHQVMFEDDIEEAYDMKMKGIMVKDIAEYFGISRSQASRVWRKSKRYEG